MNLNFFQVVTVFSGCMYNPEDNIDFEASLKEIEVRIHFIKFLNNHM